MSRAGRCLSVFWSNVSLFISPFVTKQYHMRGSNVVLVISMALGSSVILFSYSSSINGINHQQIRIFFFI